MKYFKLKEISEIKNGEQCNYSDKGIIPVYGSNGIIGYTDDLNAPENSIIIGRVGANAGSVFYSLKKHWVSDNAISVVPNVNKVNPFYLYYALFNLDLNRLVEGSAQPLINQSILNSFEISVPSLSVQTSVIEKIRVFDEKIAINNQINDNLLELLDTEFHHQFSHKTHFRRAKIRDYVKITRGSSPRPIKNFLTTFGRPWIKISDISNLSSPYLYKTKQYISKSGISKSKTVLPGTLILSNSATPGIPVISKIVASVHDGWLIISDYKLMNRNWFYLFFRQKRQELLKRANGSVFNNLKISIVENFPINAPNKDLLKRFEKISNPIFSDMEELQLENIKLTKIKEALLNLYF